MNAHVLRNGLGFAENWNNPARNLLDRSQQVHSVAIERGQVHSVDVGRRRRDVIRCLQGKIWLTQEGDLEDHLLRFGDVFLAARTGRILVSALEDSRVEVSSSRNPRH